MRSSIILLLGACMAIQAAPLAQTGADAGNTGIGGLTGPSNEALLGGANIQA